MQQGARLTTIRPNAFSPNGPRHLQSKRRVGSILLFTIMLGAGTTAYGYDISQPAILQDFESSYTTITSRMPDIFAAGYGAVYTPPPGRADTGNQSVGYDVYDRFDLGSAGNPTLYGTQAGLEQMVNAVHGIGGNAYIDLLWNHTGFEDADTPGFAASGGYPGFAVTLQTTNPNAPGYNTQGYNEPYGDFHNPSDTGDQNEQLSGLNDIDQSTNNVFIRQPTTTGPDNIPAGTTPYYGKLANQPNPANAQYYPDLSLGGTTETDPQLSGSSFTRYQFNTADPMAGTPVAENATGYLMRYAQYMVQVIGVDGFRVDAAKNMPEWVMNYLDLATYDSSNRTLLNGQQENVFSYSEVYDSNPSLLQSYVLKNINPATPNVVGGNRDVLDFPLFFAMQSNLSSSGAVGTGTNDWRNVVNASIDLNDDGLHNGSQGVSFVSSQDNGPPALSSVAYAYTLMMPGQTQVYFNGHNFGTEAQRSFPQDGREDALGGVYGNAIPTLVDLRNRYGRGNYREDWIDQRNYAFERTGSALVLLSNCTDPGYDAETIPVTFAPGTPLVELTGNAASSFADPNGSISPLLVVQPGGPLAGSGGGEVNGRFLRNSAQPTGGSSYSTGAGYLVYGLPTPTGAMSLSNIAKVISGTTPDAGDQNVAYENGTDVLSNIDVITSGSFEVSLSTTENNIPGFGHWHDADGDIAQIKIDGGIDVTGGGLITDPNSASYGYQNFATVNSPGYYANGGAGGNGNYSQTISTEQLGQGYHSIEVIAFSHNADPSAPPVYNDWKQTIYIDTAPANSTVLSFNPAANDSTNRLLQVQSVDGLADNVHVLFDYSLALSDSQVLAAVNSGNQPSNIDVNLWQQSLSNVGSGNHTVTLVSYKPDGNYSIQRFSAAQMPILSTTTTDGAGIGDTNFDNQFNAIDVTTFSNALYSNNSVFNAAADINGDGVIDLADAFLLGPVLNSHAVNQGTWSVYNHMLASSYVTSGTYRVNGANTIYNDTAGNTNLSAGASLTASSIRGQNLNLSATSNVKITPNGTSAGTSVITSLGMAGSTDHWQGQIDLTNNDLIIDYGPGADPMAEIASMLRQGYANGQWNGDGIISSSARGGGITTLAYADTAEFNPGSIGGQTPDDSSIVIKYAYLGDANLDGVVNGADLAMMQPGGSTWTAGDFNYDGTVNADDYALLTLGMSLQQAPLTQVPEPAEAVLGMLALSLLSIRVRPIRRSSAFALFEFSRLFMKLR